MSQPEVLCCGIVVADHVCSPISHVPRPGELVMSERMLLTIGGCASNTAVDLAKMDVPVAVVGKIGDDVFGGIVADSLRQQGVDVSLLQIAPGVDTSQTLIVNVKGEDRRFIHTFGANSLFRAADIPLEAVRRCKVIYLGGYLLMENIVQEELVATFEAARAAGARTVLDVATPGRDDYLPRLEKILPVTDVFLPNRDEAECITGETDPLSQAETLRKLGANTVVITCGGEGSVLVNDRVRLRAGTFPVEFVDGSGGGDAFDAGFIFGLLHRMEVEDCLRVASALGASCVRAIGTTPGVFTRQECEEFLRRHDLEIARL
ncbi:MAG: sugar kinase [Gemmatales bacterium]|nr:MAG: sugar kinase [Gemmatales bacterium]